MSRYFKSLSVQAQVNAAMFVVALLIAAGLVGALSVSGAVNRTFSDLTEKQLPKVFAALTAREEIAEIRGAADAIRLAPDEPARKRAAAAFDGKLADLEKLIARLGAAEGTTEKRFSVLRAAMGDVSKSVAAKHAAEAQVRESWARARAMHADVRKKLAEIADDTSFQMAIASEETRSSLAAGIEKVVSADVPTMVGLMSIKLELAAIEVEAEALKTAFSRAAIAAKSDQLTSTLDRLQAQMGEIKKQLPPESLKELQSTAAQVKTAIDKLVAGPAIRSKYLTSGGYDALRTQLAKVKKTVGGLVDDASFNMAISGGELTEKSSAEIEKIVKAASGDFRVALEAAATMNAALGWLGQLANAASVDRLEQALRDSVSGREKLTALTSEKMIVKAGLADKIASLVGMLGSDGAIATARRAEFAASARVDESGAVAWKELSALSAHVGALATAQRTASAEASAAAVDAVDNGRALQIGIAVASILAILAILLFFIRPRIVKPLRDMRSAVALLAKGVPTKVPGAERGDEIGSLAQSMSAIYDSSVAAQRVETALSSSNAMVLIACEQGRIRYVNRRLQEFFTRFADGLHAEWPEFQPADPVSCSLLSVAATPEMRAALESGERFSTTMEIAGRFVDIDVAPVNASDGGRQGTVIEWRDRTEVVSMRREIDRVVSAAAQGEFDTRVQVSDPESMLGKIGIKVNELLGSVSGGLEDVTHVMRAMAARDLTRTMSSSHVGAFADLSQNVNQTVASLRELLAEMVATSASLEQASGAMRMSSTDISRRAESQAAFLEETAASMEEMAASTQRNAQSATEATQRTQAAAEQAGRSDAVVRDTVDAISRTESSSDKIAEIVSVIDSIAFQTNLLALNAAVESARAGEAGKGFAVVASEVRALAQRSSEASRDIQELVTQSVVSVRESVGKVRETGAMIAQINQGVESVNSYSAEIAKASQEQASSANEIRAALRDLDATTQQNALGAEQAAAQAAELSSYADQLSQLANSFTLEADGEALNDALRGAA
ncbi:MAG: methyl-accepting chemotaxis protein [Neomegalonema sp.]|nr:methyl-accepting chemotaxis protein [Neomegalonema sp.]